MNWFKTSQLKKTAAKTLYHGTSVDKVKSIKELGLVPQVGGFVQFGYDDYEEAGIELPELTFATDKDEIDKAYTAMVQAVARMLGTHKVTENQIRAYGALVIIPGETGSAEGAQGFQRRKPRGKEYDTEWDRMYSEQFSTVEPGDYFSEEVAWPIKILTGNKMLKFFNRHMSGRKYPTNINKIPLERIKEIILRKAVEKKLAENPNADVEKLTAQGQKMLEEASEERLQKYYEMYVL